MNSTDGTSHDRTRRAFLGTTATLGTIALAGCAENSGGDGGTSTTTTEQTTTTPTTEDPATEESTAAPDVPILNYALTLEHLENAFYRDGLEEFSDHVRTEVPDHLKAIGDHEAAHVTAITDTVKKLDGTPVEEAEYDFGYKNPSEFLGVAKALENTGVAAYKGAAPTVSDDAVFEAAISIHSVEACHASVLNELNSASPFPKAVDEPKTMAEVTEIASQFIVQN